MTSTESVIDRLPDLAAPVCRAELATLEHAPVGRLDFEQRDRPLATGDELTARVVEGADDGAEARAGLRERRVVEWRQGGLAGWSAAALAPAAPAPARSG